MTGFDFPRSVRIFCSEKSPFRRSNNDALLHVRHMGTQSTSGIPGTSVAALVISFTELTGHIHAYTCVLRTPHVHDNTITTRSLRVDKRNWNARYFHTIDAQLRLLHPLLHHIRSGNHLNRFHPVFYCSSKVPRSFLYGLISSVVSIVKMKTELKKKKTQDKFEIETIDII